MVDDELNIAKLKAIDLSQARHQLVTMPLYWAAILVVIGFTAKETIADVFGLVTVSRVDHIESTLDELTLEVRMANATRQLRQFQDDLERHDEQRVDTNNWRIIRRDLVNKINLATEYKRCVFRNKKEEDCSVIRDQLWQ